MWRGAETHLGAHKTSKADCYSQTSAGDVDEGMNVRVAPVALELAISTWLTVEDLAGALSQRCRILRRNGGLA